VQGGVAGFSPDTADGGGAEKRVWRGPKGADEGGTGELTEGERNGGAAMQRWHEGSGPIGRHGREAEERGEGGDGVLGHTH
jgi:hypothetical protein